jgi:putative endonuclease
MAFVYIVECSDGTYYTGWALDVEKRVARHNSGRGAKYTRARRPVVLRYVEELPVGQARRRESQIKKLTREQKEQLWRKT